MAELEMHDGTILDVSDDAPPEVRRKIVQNWLAKNRPPALVIPGPPAPSQAEQFAGSENPLRGALEAFGESAGRTLKNARNALFPKGVLPGEQTPAQQQESDQILSPLFKRFPTAALFGGMSVVAPAAVVGGGVVSRLAGPALEGAPLLVRALGGVGEAAGVNAGLASATAPAGQAGEAAWDAAKHPLNLVGAYNPLAQSLRGAGSKALHDRASLRSYESTGPTSETNASVRRFDPSGAEAVDPGKLAAGEVVLESGALRKGMSRSELDVALKSARDQVGAAKGALVDEATALGAHPDYGALRQSLVDLRAELMSPASLTAHGPDVAKELSDFIKRLDKRYAPTKSKPLGATAGAGAQPVGQRLTPGASPYANEVGLQPPNKQTLTPIKDAPEPSAAPHSMADMEEGLPASRLPEAEAYVETYTPGHEFGKERVVWTDPINRRSFKEWEALKSEVQTKIDNMRSGFNPGGVGRDTPAVTALRKASGKITAADDAAFAQVLPEKAAAYAEAKRKYGALSDTAEAAKRQAEGPKGDLSHIEKYEARRAAHQILNNTLIGLGGGGAAGLAHSPVAGVGGALAGALAGYGASKGVQAWEQALPRRALALENMSRVAGKVKPLPIEAEQLLKYLRQQETP